MKKLLLPIMILAIVIAFIEQSKEDKNNYILLISFVVFMFGMMRLSAKTPSKKQENSEEND